jgi:hypothetical protein
VAALAQVRTARAMDAYSLQQLQPQIFCRNSVRRASRFQRIGSCSRQKRLQPQAANQGIARSNGIAFEHRNAVSPSDATVAVPSADNFSRHSQPADIDSDGCPRTLDSQIANQRRQSPGVSFDGSQLLEPRPESYSDFVNHFRNASPYIEGHRGGTFVLVIPSEVAVYKTYNATPFCIIWHFCGFERRMQYNLPKHTVFFGEHVNMSICGQVLERRDVLEPVLEDLALLHGESLARTPSP